MSWLTDQLNLDDIHSVVQSFYNKARQHTTISHFFNHIDDFQSHEEKITAFWWMALGGKASKLPNGAPALDMIRKHMVLGINDNDLKIWLSLFEETLFEQLEMGLDAPVRISAIPLRHDSRVRIREWREDVPNNPYPILHKVYETPAGTLCTSVDKSEDWPWGDHVPFIEDFLIPRSRMR